MNEIGPYVLIHITAAVNSTTSTAVSTPNNNYDICYSDIILNDDNNEENNDNKQFKIEKRKYKTEISCNSCNSGCLNNSFSSSQLLNIPLPANFNVIILYIFLY